MSSEWDKLRSFDGGEDGAFEELCAQLARAESLAGSNGFTRNGKPDGGLECFATQSDGSLVGWQAKWFRGPIGKTQWRQLDESFTTALTTYPTLARYVVCIPQDRGRTSTGRKFLMSQWNDAVDRWRKLAATQGRTVTIEYWGTSEIFDRLSKPEHLGRRRFWFDRQFLEPKWFRGRFEEVWENNRRRYRPELSVEGSRTDLFEALLQANQFVETCQEQVGNLCEAAEQLLFECKDIPLGEELTSLKASVDRLRQLASALPRSAQESIHIGALHKETKASEESAERISRTLRTASAPKSVDLAQRRSHEVGMSARLASAFIDGFLPLINDARALLLTGDAGQGKTHLLFQIADERTQRGLPVVLSCGIEYTSGNPWKQMIAGLGLECERDEFLGALEAVAEATKSRALIVIDALNESDDPAIWKKSLAGMVKALQPFRSLALAVSTRTEFLSSVVPESLLEKGLPRIEYAGFRGREAEAASKILGQFGITTPDIPLLDPEFENPLFVVTLAEGLKRAGQTTLPAGANGLRGIFDLQLDGVNARLSELEQLDYDAAERRVHRAANALAEAMAARGSKILPYIAGKALVDQIHPASSWSKSLLRALISEDVLQKYPTYDKGQRVDGVRFTYDRFADHHIARAILQKAGSRSKLKSGLGSRGALRSWLGPLSPGPQQRGVLLALAIELPEDARFTCELSAVLPQKDLRPYVEWAMSRSLDWRAPSSMSKEVIELVRTELREIKRDDLERQRSVIDRLARLAVRPAHPLNATFVDQELRSESMPQRDYWWSRPLTAVDGDGSSVGRLVDWMASPQGRKATPEVADLAITYATWLFTTSNRVIRDRATKAMVSFLMERPGAVEELIRRFIDIDDPYILERVLAVAYGVALRSTNRAGVVAMAQTVYALCFEQGRLPIHLLARDYAKGIVECAVRRGGISIDRSKIEPPYRSDWPKDISRHGAWEQRLGDRAWETDRGVWQVWKSIEHGDFGRYVIGANSGHFEWLRYRFGDPLPSVLIDEPTDRASTLLRDVIVIQHETKALSAAPRAPTEYATPTSPAPPVATASGRPLTHTEMDNGAWFPVDQLQCMVMDEVLALGYSSRLDEDVESRGRDGEYVGRSSPRSERLGKKYQWMAYWRTQSRIADRFRFGGDSRVTENAKYEGPWQISGGRDIDPSCLLRRKTAGHKESREPAWWAPFARADFDKPCTDLAWLQDTSRVPGVNDICEVLEPGKSERWIVGHLFGNLEPPRLRGLHPEGWRRRHLWYHTAAAFVRASDSARLVDWLNTERRKGSENGHNLLPERPDLHSCFLGEFPHGAAWNRESIPYFNRDPWGKPMHRHAPVPLSLLSDGYFRDDELDCGRDEVLNFCLPSAELFNDLQLQHATQDGHYVDTSGNLVAWDPSITQKGPIALLLRREPLLEYIRRRKLHLVLFTFGEQRATAEGLGSDDYLGQLLFSGTFLHNGTAWSGAMDARFDPPRPI